MKRGLATFQYLGHSILFYFCWLFIEAVPLLCIIAELAIACS